MNDERIKNMFREAGLDPDTSRVPPAPGAIDGTTADGAAQLLARSIHDEIARCGRCGKPYPFALDVTLPNDQWEMVSQGVPLLCETCILERAAQLTGVVAARMWLDDGVKRGPEDESKPSLGPVFWSTPDEFAGKSSVRDRLLVVLQRWKLDQHPYMSDEVSQLIIELEGALK